MIRLFDQHEVRSVHELSGTWMFHKYNDAQQYQLAVPGCWEEHPDLATFRGEGIYERNIEVTTDGQAVRLIFEGVSHTADVFFDGAKVAHHYNAFTPFAVVVPSVAQGLHKLQVRVDNRFSEASALHKPNDYYTYGGLIRTASVEFLNTLYIENIQFSSAKTTTGWHVMVDIKVDNLSADAVDTTLLINLAGSDYSLPITILSGHESRQLTWTHECSDVKAWAPQHPTLYALKVTASVEGQVVDDLIERVGFREVKTLNDKILLNDEPIFLQGFNRHEDTANYGSAVPLQQMVQDIDLMVDMGANAVRTCHYPNNQLFLDLCDERGILVWEEAHARGLSLADMQNPNFDAQCSDCNREMVAAHYNHPSIVIWGILNECASEKADARPKYQAQYDQIRELDSTRPMTSATCKHFEDLCLDLPDIVSYNIYSGWYEDVSVKKANDRELDWLTHSDGQGKPMIVSEFGAAAIYGYRNRNRCKWSEERQAEVIEECLQTYLTDDRLTGAFIWQFADCRVTDEEWFMVRPRAHNNKGIVDEYRRPKLAYEVVQRLFKENLARRVQKDGE